MGIGSHWIGTAVLFCGNLLTYLKPLVSYVFLGSLFGLDRFDPSELCLELGRGGGWGGIGPWWYRTGTGGADDDDDDEHGSDPGGGGGGGWSGGGFVMSPWSIFGFNRLNGLCTIERGVPELEPEIGPLRFDTFSGLNVDDDVDDVVDDRSRLNSIDDDVWLLPSSLITITFGVRDDVSILIFGPFDSPQTDDDDVDDCGEMVFDVVGADAIIVWTILALSPKSQ